MNRNNFSKSQTFLSLTAMGFLVLVQMGCSEGNVFRNRANDYKMAQECPSLSIPKGIAAATPAEDYCIPAISELGPDAKKKLERKTTQPTLAIVSKQKNPTAKHFQIQKPGENVATFKPENSSEPEYNQPVLSGIQTLPDSSKGREVQHAGIHRETMPNIVEMEHNRKK